MIPGFRTKNWWDMVLDERAQPYMKSYERGKIRLQVWHAALAACRADDEGFVNAKTRNYRAVTLPRRELARPMRRMGAFGAPRKNC